MKKINLGQKDIIHFIGIGGIGMSGLAQIMGIWGLKYKEMIKIKIKTLLAVLNWYKNIHCHSTSNLKKQQ